jgi:CBS-domain-containing membrane protein
MSDSETNRSRRPLVEILYLDGCPNHEPAVALVQRVQERVVLGRFGRAALQADEEQTVEETMSEGPGTVRPNEPLEPLRNRLDQRGLRTTLVTTSDGKLVGVVVR